MARSTPVAELHTLAFGEPDSVLEPYPIRTQPFFRDYLWGGRKLGSVLGKDIPESGIWAESWEFVDHDEHQSLIVNGPLAGQSLRDVAQAQPEWLFGQGHAQLPRLPLLLKYLDCQRVLSVQVHPSDDYARNMSPPDLGKTEAWYIVSAEPGAKLYAGLKKDIGQSELQTAIDSGQVEDCLHALQPSAGDCVFIPAGTVHALGAGLLVAEIQQASNTTFRLYDWERLGADGKPRALHIQQALDVIDFSSGPQKPQETCSTTQDGRQNLVKCDKFILDRLTGGGRMEVGGDGKFHLLTVPQGQALLDGLSQTSEEAQRLTTGQSVLLPGSMATSHVQLLDPQSVVLDMYLP